MEEMVEVIVPKNIRIFNDYDTDLVITAGAPVPVTERQLRALTLRYALLEGKLRVAKGTVTFPFKDSTVIIHGEPEGNTQIEFHNPERGVEIKTFDMRTTIQKVADAKIAEKPAKKHVKKPVKKPVKKTKITKMTKKRK